MSASDRPTGSDPEQVLSQALRAMAGGGRRPDRPAGSGSPSAPPRRRSWWSRLTTVQVVLLALTVGVSIGVVTGIIVLLIR